MNRAARYATVGVAATALHGAVLEAGVRLGLAAGWAAALGAVIGAQLAYAGNALFTFSTTAPAPRSWWRFQQVAALCAITSAAMVTGGTALGVHHLLAQAVASLLVLAAGYALNRRYSFAP